MVQVLLGCAKVARQRLIASDSAAIGGDSASYDSKQAVWLRVYRSSNALKRVMKICSISSGVSLGSLCTSFMKAVLCISDVCQSPG